MYLCTCVIVILLKISKWDLLDLSELHIIGRSGTVQLDLNLKHTSESHAYIL